MSQIPEPNVTIENKIDWAHEARREPPRAHLGASLLGKKCDRALWLSFRWAVIEPFPGRILRLFRRGHHEENWIVEDLKSAGINIKNTGEDQKRLDFGCHVGGSVDGIIEGGVPGAEKTQHIAEFKTHALKSFTDLQNNGVLKSKPEHWAQMQLYMLGTKINRALYLAVCKNDDHIYTERIRYDKEAAETLLARGHKIVKSERIPDPLSTDPSWYECRFCSSHEFCHSTKLTKEVNCRTCANATAEDDSTWSCAKWGPNVPYEHQLTGCSSHALHPDLVPWDLLPSEVPFEAVYDIEGIETRNGEYSPDVFSSRELVLNGKGCTDPLVKKVRDAFPGSEVAG